MNGSERVESEGNSFHFENAPWGATRYLCPLGIFIGIFTIPIVKMMQKQLQKNSVKLPVDV